MKRVLLFAFLILMSISMTGYAAVISGKVVDAKDDTPIEGATVRVEKSDRSVQTDSEGNYTIDNVGSSANILITHVGFTAQRKVNLEPGSDNLIKLAPSTTVLNSVVVTTNRFEKAAYKVSQPITIARSDEIENKGYTIVSDVIRNFPGVDMNDAGPFRARPVIRGLYGTRILVLVDGERLNDQRDVADFAGSSMSLVDASEIDRVEVVNGPSSVLYGSDAMGGVINIMTKRNGFTENIDPFFNYSSRYSTADQQHANRINVGVSTPKLSLSGGYQYRKAEKDYSLPKNWTKKDPRYNVFNSEFYDSLSDVRGTSFTSDRLANTRAEINNYDFRLGYRLARNHRADFDFGAFRGSDIGYPGVPNDSTPYLFAYPKHDRDNISLSYTGTGLTKKMARMDAKIYYEKISKDFFTDFYDGIQFPAGPGAFGYPETSLSKTKVEKTGLNFQELYRMSDSYTLTYGFDAWQEKIDGDVTSITRFEGFGPFPVYDTSSSSSVPRNRWRTLGVYATNELWLDQLQVNAGLRWDNYWINTYETPGYVDSDNDDEPLRTQDEKYSALNGSLGLVYPIGNGVNAVADIGTAYRVPNVVERFYYGSASGRETRPNPDIKPEKSISYNVGIKAVHPHINYSLTGFYSDYTDFTQLQNYDSLEVVPNVYYTPLWRYENVQDVTIYGFEGLIEANLENGLYGSLIFTYQHGQNNTDNQPIFVSPVKTILTAGYRSKKNGLFGEVTLRKVEDNNRVADVTTLDDIPSLGFTVVNATVGTRLFDAVRLSLSANNIFDEVYSEPFNSRNPDNPIPEPGRNFVLSLTAGLGQ